MRHAPGAPSSALRSSTAMPSDSPPIIARPSTTPDARRTTRLVFGLALVAGSGAAAWYASADLTVSHYDARAHLVVARRVIDSLTPGWRQIGAVWLPLPHVIQVLPMQSDVLYRTGASAVAVSVAILAWGLAALSGLIVRRTGSVVAAVTAPVLILANPNVLYLQSTPMTEAMLWGLSLLALTRVDEWLVAPSASTARRAGLWILLLMLTRYEGWCIGLSLVAVGALAARHRGPRVALALAPWAGGAMAGFSLLSRLTVGEWFVASGFFVPENPARHDAVAVAGQILAATTDLSGWVLVAAASIGAIAILARARRGLEALLPLALVTAGALPFVAFYAGHPLRVRYMTSIVVAAGVLAAWSIASAPRRLAAPLAMLLAGLAAWQAPPLSSRALMVQEAQWETPFRLERRRVTASLASSWDGTPILASMGSLAHYMQETSAIGLDLHDFLHEGNFYLWEAALHAPARHVRWMLIEERAEGGDVLAARARESAAFLDGFTRVAEGGGVALYQRVDGAARTGSGTRR